jgi:hypothetical protein
LDGELGRDDTFSAVPASAVDYVAITAGLLLHGALRRKKHHGCGCPANELKAKIRAN